MAKDLPGVVKVETKSEVQDARIAAAAKKPDTYQNYIDEMKRKEQEAVVVKSGDLEVVDAPGDERARKNWLKEVQAKKLLHGYDPKTGVALLLKEVSRARIDNARKGK